MVEFRIPQHFGHTIGHDGTTNRDVARAEALGDCHDIRRNPDRLRAEPIAGAPEAADHLIRDQQDVVFFDDPLDFRPIGFGRYDHAARTLDRFRDERRNAFRPDLLDLRFQLARTLQPEFLGRHISAFGPPMGLVDELNAGDRQTALAVHPFHAPQRGAAYGRAVIGVPARDNHITLRLAFFGPIGPYETNVGVIRVRPAIGKEHLV